MSGRPSGSHRADAPNVDAQAKRRLADEYDASQERGEARKRGGNDKVTKLPDGKFGPADVGISDKELHEARAIGDAEKRDPDIVRRTVTVGKHPAPPQASCVRY